MLERWQIILLCLVFIVVWMLGKKLFQRPEARESRKTRGLSDGEVESWFSTAQERAAFGDEETRKARTSFWTGLSETEQLHLAEDFIASTFGDAVSESYSVEEKLRIAHMCVMAGDRTP